MMTERPGCMATRSRFRIVYPECLRSLVFLMCNIVLCLTFVLVACRSTRSQSSIPVITFTQVPEANPGDHDQQDVIEGKVTGARSGQRIVIYARVGKLWWVQPLVNSPFTPILPDQVWRNETHLGMQYAAILVADGNRPAATMSHLPPVGGSVAAVAISKGQQSSSSVFVNFSGFKWRVRTAPSDRGGTSNLYDPRNVYTDQSGALHLGVVNRNGRWTCSEVNLTRSLGYGTYSFDADDTSTLEPSAVFGMFTWDYSSKDQNHREFDIEISKWGDPNRKNAQYVLQPYYIPFDTWQFTAPAGKLTHTIVWEPGRIAMTTSTTTTSRIVAKHIFAPDVPTPGAESVRINLYSFFERRRAFTPLRHGAEVIVRRFSYLP